MPADKLDCSDLDQYMGKPMQPARMVEPFANCDIRRWVQAMHYPNRLHYDTMYTQQSRHGELIAPQSFPVTMDDAHGSAPSCIGKIPNSHMLFGGDEWWFYGPTVRGGDRIWNERIPFDYSVKDTSSFGPTCFQRGDNFYYNQHGDLVAKQRSTSIRYSQVAGEAEAPRDAPALRRPRAAELLIPERFEIGRRVEHWRCTVHVQMSLHRTFILLNVLSGFLGSGV